MIRGLKARAQLALHRKGAGPGAATTRLDKYDLVQQILSGGPASGQHFTAMPKQAHRSSWVVLLALASVLCVDQPTADVQPTTSWPVLSD